MARILTLTNWYPPHHFGGYEVLCREVMTSLHERGHQVEVLCSDEIVPGAVESAPAPFPVHRQLRMYWRDGAPWVPSFSEQRSIERSNQQRLNEALDEFSPDVVSVWHMGALSLSLLTTLVRRRIPLVYAICDEWLIYGLQLDPWSRRWYSNPIRRAAGRLAERVVATPTVVADIGAHGCFCFLSEHTKEASIATSPWSYPVAPVVYPGIDLSRFRPGTTQEWQWRLLFMGRLDSRKGTDTLLRAMKLLPGSATLALLGRGEPHERARLQAMTTELGLEARVRFEPIAREDLADAYRSHDCVVFPSEWPEPFGMVPLEAMACGIPVVTTGMGGLAEYLVDHQNSVVVEPGNENALAEGVTELAEDPTLRQTLRSGGLATASRFDVRRTTDAYEVWHLAAAEHRLDAADMPTVPTSPSRPLRARAAQWWRGWHR